MDTILDIIGGNTNAKVRNDDDAIDRMSYKYTTAILVAFAVAVSTSQFVGDPIHCWVPAHFSDSHESYTDSYCWVRNTYYLPFTEYIPKEHEHDKRHEIPYYQWVPVILLVQALLFYLPTMFWRTLNNKSGVDLNNIVELGESYQKADDGEDGAKEKKEEAEDETEGACAESLLDSAQAEKREEPEEDEEEQEDKKKEPSEKEQLMHHMTLMVDRYLESQKDKRKGWTISMKNVISKTCCFFCGREKGNYLTVLYLLTKLLYLGNIVGQFFLLTSFLGTDYYFYGFSVVKAMAMGEDWTQSERFPRVTMCDFKVRRLGNIQRYTVQCVLSINLFNEKIYLFVWFWLLLMGVLTFISLFGWAVRNTVKKDHHRFILRRLKMENRLRVDKNKQEEDFKNNKKIAYFFVEKYLMQDGVFILRLVTINTDMITGNDLLYSLWDLYKEKNSKWRTFATNEKKESRSRRHLCLKR